MDIAALGLRVDGVENIDKATKSLEDFSGASNQAAKSTTAVASGAKAIKPAAESAASATDKLSAAELKLARDAERAGMSVKQLQFALRGVPAQFTDIAVSLQAGMNPLTVFLQQGGQLKDMFNGAGFAARALAGYIVGLVNPFSVAAASVAALGVAYYQGSKEADVFRATLAQTGNSAGVTVGTLQEYARQMAATSGTQGKAAETLNLFVSAGVRAQDNLVRFAQTAQRWEKATGEGVDAVAEKFAALQKEPVTAALKLNDSMNFLTVSVYSQIKALEDQGKATEAARVAMEALDSAMAERAKNIEQSLGYIERAWNGITGAAKRGWDAMLDVGRPDTTVDKIRKIQEEIDRRMTQPLAVDNPAMRASREKGIANLQRELMALQALHAQEELGAAGDAERLRQTQARAAWDKITTGNLDKQAKMEAELTKVREAALQAGISGKELEDQLAAVREKYAEKTKKASTATLTAYQSLMVAINEKIAASEQEILTGEKQTEADKLRVRYQQELITRGREFNKVQRANIEAGIEQYAAQEAYNESLKYAQKVLDDYAKKQDQQIQKVSEQVEKLRLEEDGHKLAAAENISHAEAMERLTLARLEDALAQMKQGAGSEAEIERLTREIAKRRELLELMGAKGTREANEKAAKELEKQWEKTAQTVGDTLADYIMGGGKDAATYLKRLFSTLVLQPIVQAGVGGFLGSIGLGGSSASGTASTISNAASFASFAANAKSYFSLAKDFFTGAMSGSNAAGTIFANASGTGLDGLIASQGGWGTSSGSAGSVGGLASAWPAAIAAGMIASNKLFGQGFSADNFSSSQKIGDIGNYFQTKTLAPVLGERFANILTGAPLANYIWNSIVGKFDNSGTPHMGAGAIYSGGQVSGGRDIYNRATFGMGARGEWSASNQDAISGIAAGLGSALDGFAKAFGKEAGYTVATAFADDSSDDGAWGSLKIADALGNTLVDWEQKRASKWAPREFSNGEEGYKEYLNAIAQDVKSAFVAMDLPGWADQVLNAATDIETLSAALTTIGQIKAGFDSLGKSMQAFSGITADTQTILLEQLGSFEAVSAAADTFYQNFYAEDERVRAARMQMLETLQGLGVSIDPGFGDAAKDQFRALIETSLQAGQAELAAKLLAMSDAFSQVADYAQQATDSLRSGLIGIESQFSSGGMARQYRAEDAATQIQSMLSGVGIGKDVGALTQALMSATSSDVEAYFREIWGALNTDEAKQKLIQVTDVMLDLASATDAAAESAAAAASAIAAERASLEQQMLQMVGATAQLRQRELDALDPSNRALKEMIYALEDLGVAAQEIAQKASQAWGGWGTAASLAAQYTGDTSGLSARQSILAAQISSSTDAAQRLSLLQELISTEQALGQAQQQVQQREMDAINARQTALQTELQNAKNLLSAAKGLGDYVKQLRLGEESGLSDADRMATLGSEYAALLGKARGGDAGALQQLQSVTGDYLGIARELSASGSDYSVLSGRIAAELESVSKAQELVAQSQVTGYEGQILQLTQQTDLLSQGVELSDGTKSLITRMLTEQQEVWQQESARASDLASLQSAANSALAAMPKAMYGALSPLANYIASSVGGSIGGALTSIAAMLGIDGSHASGLPYVPFDGYRAELHKGERVLTAQQNQAYSAGVPSGAVRSFENQELVAEVRALRQQNALLIEMIDAIKQNTGQFAEQFDNVTAGGNAMATEVIG